MLFDRSEKSPKLDQRLQELETDLATLQRQMRELQIEWASVYEKIRSVVMRLNKRTEREDAIAAEPAVPSPGRLARTPNGDGARPAVPHLPGPTERNY